MKKCSTKNSAVDVLLAARLIADFAKDEGAIDERKTPRATCEHMGVVLADSVLQAGLNYTTVVRPRIAAILRTYPECDSVSSLQVLIRERRTEEFLNWRHPEKVARFESLVQFLWQWGVDRAEDLRSQLVSERFCEQVQSVHGIGPKTVDYMACLVGIDSIAVDRHVRTFAKKVGVETDDYYFLRRSFCYAADLLSVSRREFDAWLWRRAASPQPVQLSLAM